MRLFFLLLCLSVSQLYAQSYSKNECLVALESQVDIRFFIEKARWIDDISIHIKAEKQLAPSLNWWLISFDNEKIDIQNFIAHLYTLDEVIDAQVNHYIESRSTIPNDPLYSNQWQYDNNGANGGTPDADLDAPEAWDITTGGQTSTNDEVVIAILDDGVDMNHADLLPNLWKNTAEIPNNNIDDDQNGYVDDFHGWNTDELNDNISINSNAGEHGTPVAGIIGAKGDNGIGVAGVNWDVKMMIVRTNLSTSEADIIAGYGYVLEQRKRYNQTQGAEGAYVVATNASWGVDYGMASSAPLWCQLYDTLGKYGILNVAATTNNNVDVDIQGDLPTTCPSDYLIAVTNVNRLGEKVFSAATGSTHIDLGAFGESVYTTSNLGYYIFGGTSAATPHVTGSIGLLYAASCQNFMVWSHLHPDSAALQIKNYILSGVVNESTLSNTATGGYLNLYNSVYAANNTCQTGCIAPYGIEASSITDTSAHIHWEALSTTDSIFVRYRMVSSSWATPFVWVNNDDSLYLNNLTACSDYEVEFYTICGNQQSTVIAFSFATDGCCTAPTNLVSTELSNNRLNISWDPLLTSQSYILSYQVLPNGTWVDIDTIYTNNYILDSLLDCHQYQIKVRAICQNGDTTNYSLTENILTDGCQGCNALSYCSMEGQNTTYDWIESFTIDAVTYESGHNDGYWLFDNETIVLEGDKWYPYTLEQGGQYLEYLKIWIDFNQDGDFDDSNELCEEATISYISNFQDSFYLPAIYSGQTRMRVALRWSNPPELCTDPSHGEIEDYCIFILQPTMTTAIEQVSSLTNINAYPNPTTDLIHLEYELQEAQEQLQIVVYNINGQIIQEQTISHLQIGKQHQTLSLASAVNGLYYIRLISEDINTTINIIKTE